MKAIKSPLAMVGRTEAVRRACAAASRCRWAATDGGHLAADRPRAAWISMIRAFIEAQASGHVVGAAP